MLGVGRIVVPLPIVSCPCHLVMSMMKHTKDKHKKRKGISKEQKKKLGQNQPKNRSENSV